MQKWLPILLLVWLWTGCKPEASPEEYIPQMKAYATGQQECVRLAWLLREAAMGNEQMVDSFAPGASYTEEPNGSFRALRLAFGDTLLCADGRRRSGSLNVLAGPAWPAPGSEASVFLSAYRVRTLSDIGASLHADAWELRSLPPANGAFPVMEHRPRGLRWNLGGAAVTWRDTFRQVMIMGFDTPFPDDDLLLIDGETTINLDAVAHEVRFAPPLSFRPGCAVLTGGKAIFQQAEAQTITIDFGLDECNKSARIQLGESDPVSLDLLD